MGARGRGVVVEIDCFIVLADYCERVKLSMSHRDVWFCSSGSREGVLVC
jgi:hypothetical protein